MPSDGPMCILDPCAGEGVAIAEAAHALGREQAKAFAVEFDAERGATPAAWSITASTADLMDTMVSSSRSGCSGSTRRMATCPGRQRQHRLSGWGRARLKSCSISVRCRCCSTAACWSSSSPSYVLDAELVGWLTRHFTDLRIYRAVETQFKQVVIFGRRFASANRLPVASKAVRNLLLQIGLGDAEAEELPSEWPFLPYIVPASPAGRNISIA